MRSGTDYNVIVPIPDDAHVCKDHRVYVVEQKIYYKDLQYNMDTRIWLGKAISDKEMHPNNNYKEKYPDVFRSITHLHLPQYVKHIGVYAAALKIAEDTKLYEDLRKQLGIQNANLVLDYAVYSIMTKSNVAKDFESEMKEQMTFLDRVYSDSWMGEKIDNAITDNHVQAFKNAWLKRFGSQDEFGVWLCIDGSNEDCRTDIDEAEKGKAKSHKNVDIISFLYAVTETGVPVTSQVYRGSRVDSQALKEMLAIMSGYKMTIKGVILDRGFCTDGCIELLNKNEYDYVIMMKEGTLGFETLLSKYQNKIKYKYQYALGHGLFGASEAKIKPFNSSKAEVSGCIIWDCKNGSERISYLIDEVMEAAKEAEEAIANKTVPKIPPKLDDYVSVVNGENGLEVKVDAEAVDSENETKGFYGLICRNPMTAKEADRVYNLRDASEKQYSILKTQLGNDALRVHSMHRIQVRELIAFVAAIIRHGIMTRCRSGYPVYDTNVAIKELKLININLIGDTHYKVIHNQSTKQKEIMARIGLDMNNLDYIAGYETKRFKNEAVSPIHCLKDSASEEEKQKTQHVEGIPEGSSAKGKGSKSKATTPEDSGNESGTRHRGRPKGSKNKQKTENSETVHRGRGRPKGSKNKQKSENDEPPVQRKRGRPKGSKNKSKK